MTSFAIGKVVEPVSREVTIKGKKRMIFSLGLLVGRSCVPFDIFDDSPVFEKAAELQDGDSVIAVVGDSVDDKGKLRHYLNDIAEAPEGLRDQLRSLF